MSDKDDPFAAFESDRTVIKPSAGRGGAARPPTAATPAAGAATSLSATGTGCPRKKGPAARLARA